MSPGDPNQVDAELIMYHLAMILAAICGKIESDSQKVDFDHKRTINISPVDVVDHIGCQGDGAHGELEEGERAEKFCKFDQNLFLIILSNSLKLDRR